MRKLMAIAIAVGAMLVLSTSASTAQTKATGVQNGAWTWGPSTCVHVRSAKSRQTRYAGAPRCRRVPV